ncbi:hypothetical protein PGB90_002392 [Kerria lacca]
MKIFLAFIFICYVVIVLAQDTEEVLNNINEPPEVLNNINEPPEVPDDDDFEPTETFSDNTEPTESTDIISSFLKNYFNLPLHIGKLMFTEPIKPLPIKPFRG